MQNTLLEAAHLFLKEKGKGKSGWRVRRRRRVGRGQREKARRRVVREREGKWVGGLLMAVHSFFGTLPE